MKRRCRDHARSSIRSWRNTSGLRRSLSKCLSAGTTRQSSVSPTGFWQHCPPARFMVGQPATIAIGMTSEPGRANCLRSLGDVSRPNLPEIGGTSEPRDENNRGNAGSHLRDQRDESRLFETLQGNSPTNGVIIAAISESMRRWTHGGETAFTLIPNFLITGLAAIVVSLAIIIWSVGYLHTKHGAAVFLLLFILLFLVGGGIGQVIFFTVGWAFATRINKPLTWWRKILPEGVRGSLAKVWPGRWP
jgi:hypothetical protein